MPDNDQAKNTDTFIRRGWHTRGYMPHRDDCGLVQHVTFRLADSLPDSAIMRIEHELESIPETERSNTQQTRFHEWLDAGHGSCLLRVPIIAYMVIDTLHHFDERRYHLHAWVVMPNHVHVLFQPINDWPLAKIVASWKKFTARRINDFKKANLEIGDPLRAICGQGPVWHREYWDRYIRDQSHYERVIAYIHNNPVNAGLVGNQEDWVWSSANSQELT